VEAFAPIFLFWIIIIFVSVVTKNSKQNAGKKGSAGNAGGQKAANRAGSASPRPAQAKPASAPQPRKAATAAERKAAPVHEEHAAMPLEAHMHTMEMDREGEGAEGIDCCHDYMLAPSEPAPMQDFSSLSANDESQRAHALLQGVVFSEILGRRPVRRYGGKRA